MPVLHPKLRYLVTNKGTENSSRRWRLARDSGRGLCSDRRDLTDLFVLNTRRSCKVQDVDRRCLDVCVDGSLCLGQDLVGELYETVPFAPAGS